MSSQLIPLLLITPILFGIFGFIFSTKARVIGVAFGVVFFTLSLFLLYEVATDTTQNYYFGAWLTPLGIVFTPSPFGSAILALSALILLVVSIYGSYYFKRKNSLLFYPLSSFLALGFVVIYLSRDIFNIYVGLEILGLSSVGLTALQKGIKSLHAALIYLFATLIASGFYLLGVAIIYAKYSLLDISSLSLVIESDFATLSAFSLMIMAFLIKTAVFPLAFWLPQAHANALTPVSALLSALVIKATFYLLYLFTSTLFLFASSLMSLLGLLGIVAIFYGGIKAFLSSDLKLLIAYSTISQVGYLLLVFAFMSEYAYYAMAFALFSHALAKSGFFLAAGVMVHLAQTKNISAFQGYASITPVAVFAIALSAISLIGLPPSLGFVSKWYYLQSSFLSESWLFFVAILVGGLLTALYLFKLLILFLQTPHNASKKVRIMKHKNLLEWSAFFLSFLSIFLGFFSSFIINFLEVQ